MPPMDSQSVPPQRRGRVLIVGGSTRAAAWSAVRAGWQPICADLFADLDTHQVAEVIPVRDYPWSLPDDVASVQAEGWFYTGALENHPGIIERLAQPNASYGPLWGTTAAGLRLVRDPFWLATTLRDAGLPTLNVEPETATPPADGTWMQKPFASAGGRAIRVWDKFATETPFTESHYFQRRTAGESCSAVFRVESHEVEWLGASRQFINLAASHAAMPFAYCGSIGPIDRPTGSDMLTTAVRQMLTRMAETVAQAGSLRGLFSIDFLLDGEHVWPTEINPRYTASVEILELSNGRPLLPMCNGHLCRDHSGLAVHTADSFVAKVILYAPRRLTAPDTSHLLLETSPWQTPFLADIPMLGTLIESEWPICTVFADGRSLEECRDRVMQRAADSERLVLTPMSPPVN